MSITDQTTATDNPAAEIKAYLDARWETGTAGWDDPIAKTWRTGDEQPTVLRPPSLRRLVAANKATADRLATLESRQDAIWDVVLELRRNTAASGLDPYKDTTAQALSAILTGATAWQITYGTLIEARDELEAAKARSLDLWERTKFEAEEHATGWEERADGTLALIAWDEERWFDCGPVIRRLGDEPQAVGQAQIAGVAR